VLVFSFQCPVGTTVTHTIKKNESFGMEGDPRGAGKAADMILDEVSSTLEVLDGGSDKSTVQIEEVSEEEQKFRRQRTAILKSCLYTS